MQGCEMRRLLLGLVLIATLVTAYSCKQGEGDVCQINDDCEDGLSCNAGTGRCQLPGASVPDAAPPQPDADVADAGIDADVPDADIPDADLPDAT